MFAKYNMNGVCVCACVPVIACVCACDCVCAHVPVPTCYLYPALDGHSAEAALASAHSLLGSPSRETLPVLPARHSLPATLLAC